MDVGSCSKILSYVVCELTMPVKRHTYNFLANDQSTLNHHLLSAAGTVASKQSENIAKQRKVEDSNPTNTEHTDSLLSSSVEQYFSEDSSEEISSKSNFVVRFKEPESAMSSSCKNNFDTPVEGNDFQLGQEANESFEQETQVTDDSKLEQTDSEYNIDPNLINSNGGIEEMQEYDEVIEDTENDCVIVASSNDPMFGADTDHFVQSSETEFKNMFKITHSTFENLVEFLSKEQMEPIENIPLYKKLLIVLWLIGNSGSYSDAADIFSVTEEAAANCFFDVCATLYNQCDNVITWPGLEECNEIASRIEKNYGFPGVVGILGCHYFSISIPKESYSRREHFNAKQKTYCIALQIVCDDNLMIRDIFPGLPGGITESQIFQKSPICDLLTSQTQSNQLIEPHKHILARSTYPQLASVLTPYTEASETLSKEELELNELHENVCQLVDQTLEMLQDRFATLRLLDPEVATMVLVVACVIHNFCVRNGDLFGIEN